MSKGALSDVQPLAFLLVRSIVNGVKRAVTSPKRLIALAIFGLYYYNLFMRPFEGARRMPDLSGAPRFTLPPASAIDAGVFGLVGVMSLLLMTSVLSYKGGFRAADVDVLFPTPVSPRVVLLFRIARDTLATLLLPLVVILIGYRSAAPTLAGLFRDYPKQGGDIFRALTLAYLFVSLVWVCVGYAASLFVNRSDLQSDRNRKVINAGIGLFIVTILVYVAVRMRMDFSVATLIDVAHAPLLRILLAPVTLATWAVMGAFHGNMVMAVGGFLGLVALVAVALGVALTQVGWMYDQAAVRGFDTGPNMRDLQRKGDIMGIQAERARQGKLKHGRIARRIAGLKVRGPAALLWKEGILQARGSLSGLFLIGGFFLGFTGLIVWSAAHKGQGAGWAIMGGQGMMVYVLAMASAQSGFIELLRRVDVQKPLPFTPAATVFWEVLAKAVAPTILGLLAALVGVAIAPAAWPFAVTGLILTPAFSVLLSAVVLLVIVLFPDVEDPTQRMFRGLMMLLALVICVPPGAAILLGIVIALKASPLVAAIPVAAIDLGIALGLSTLAGGFYANYNPSE